jgi:hypothetical protein
MSDEEVERRSLEDLEAVLQEAHKQGIKLVIIGGYAVAAEPEKKKKGGSGDRLNAQA